MSLSLGVPVPFTEFCLVDILPGSWCLGFPHHVEVWGRAATSILGPGWRRDTTYLLCRYRSHPLGSMCHCCYSCRWTSSWGHRCLWHRARHRPHPGGGREALHHQHISRVGSPFPTLLLLRGTHECLLPLYKSLRDVVKDVEMGNVLGFPGGPISVHESLFLGENLS